MGLFATRVARRVPLSRAETAFLDALEARPSRHPPRHVLARAGEPAREAFVLISGWAMSYSQFDDGTLQIRRLHFPGDLLAMPSVPMQHHAEDIETLSEALVATFPKRMLAELFELPRLAAVMYMFAQAERISAGDRLACLGRTSAKGRVAFLLIDILHRLRAAGEASAPRFRLHLTREQMAHVTGMTPVHASRMWSALIAEGLIACDGLYVTILDEERLLRLSGYRAYDRDFDFDWLRHVGGELLVAGRV
jgi:CRP-like cAMP-binding protein